MSELSQRIASMNLSDLNLYAKGKIEGLPPSEEGLSDVLKRLTSQLNENRYFLDESDDDSKLKKAFDLVLYIAKSKKITMDIVEKIVNFTQQYAKLIQVYDKKHKEIYAQRFKKAVEDAGKMLDMKVALQNKMNILD